jgi:hypothetical protein
VKAALEETLMALSDDRFDFTFVPSDAEPAVAPGSNSAMTGWQADRVIMFSGGLDSLSGALEEMVEHNQGCACQPLLLDKDLEGSERPCSRPAPSLLGERAFRHLPSKSSSEKAATAKARIARARFFLPHWGSSRLYRLPSDRVSFHENGVVSLNLPPVGNVLSTRATRTTHPRTLALFSKLFSRVASRTIRIDNPSFWKTKTEVMETIGRLGGADLIGISASCADTHNRTTQHPHCGRCSQCVDRRFAALASGLDLKDPAEAYALDLMEGVRTDARDREIALSYVRNAVIL